MKHLLIVFILVANVSCQDSSISKAPCKDYQFTNTFGRAECDREDQELIDLDWGHYRCKCIDNSKKDLK